MPIAKLKYIWGTFLYHIGRWFASGSIVSRVFGYSRFSEQLYNTSISIHEAALNFFEKTSISVKEYRKISQLNSFLKSALQNSPFYRELLVNQKISGAKIKSMEDFQKIPILEKERIKADYKKFIMPHPVSHYLPDETSGSTGAPLRFYLDRCSIPELKARLFHLWRSVGAEPYKPTLLLSSPKYKKITPKNIIHLNPTQIHNNFEQIISQIRKIRPLILRGNPLATLEFCWLVRKLEIQDVNFKTAILYGNILTSGMRSFIEETLQCKAFSLYALGEIGGIAEECYCQNGHHVVTDSIIIEVVDKNGKNVPNGVTGRIIVTDLTNWIIPFIRYDTGDLGKFFEYQCPCGKPTPLLFINGREEEMLMRRDETLVFGGSTRDVLDKYNNVVERYQIFQEKIGEFNIKIVPTNNFNQKAERMMSENLKEIFGTDAKISIEYVAAIPLEPSGKFKQFTSLPWKKRFPSGTFSGSAQ